MKFFARDLPGWLRANLGVGLGIGLFAQVLAVAGLAGFFSPPAVLLVAAVGLVAACMVIRLDIAWKKPSRWEGIFLGFATAAVLLTGLQALLPPTGRDALVHHLALPLWYLRHGRISEIPFAVPGYYPMLLDVWFALPLALGQAQRRFDILTHFQHYLFALLTAHLLWGYCRKNWGGRAAWAAVALFLSLPVVVQLGTQAYVDLGLGYYTTAAWILLDHWAAAKSPKTKRAALVLSGMAFGFVLSAKYNGYLVLAVSLPVVLLSALRTEKSPSAALKALLVCAAIALVVHSPWLLRNFVWTGDPIFPFLRSTLGWKPAPVDGLSPLPPLVHRLTLYQESWLEVLLLPARVLLFGEENNPQLFDGRLSPILILSVFSLTAAARRGHVQRLKAIWFLTGCFFIFSAVFVILRIRYLMPVVPALVVLTIVAIEGSGERMRRGFYILLVVMLAVHTFWGVQRAQRLRLWDYLGGQLGRGEYLARRLPEYRAQSFANARLDPASAKILFVLLGDRGYYSDIPYVYDFYDPGQSWRRWLRGNPDEATLTAAIHSEGITHLMIQRELFQESLKDGFLLRAGEAKRLQEFLAHHTRSLYRDPTVELLEMVE